MEPQNEAFFGSVFGPQRIRMKQNFSHIDVAKGFGILLVVLGHNVIVGYELHRIIFSFHVPLFFFLSGLFFSPEIAFSQLLMNKTKSLLKPYAIFMILGSLYVAYRHCPLFDYLVYILYGTPFSPLWFVTHLWLLFVFAWGVTRLTGFHYRQGIQKIVIIGVLFLSGVFLLPVFRSHSELVKNMPFIVFGMPIWPPEERIINPPGLPFSADLVLLTGCYFLAGFLLKNRIIAFQFNTTRFVASLTVFAALHYFFDYTMNLYLGVFDDLLVTTLESVLGIYLVIGFSCIISRFETVVKVLAYIGTGSLFILIFHNYIQGGTYILLDLMMGRHHYMNGMIAFVAGCAFPLLLWEIVKSNKWLRVFWLP